MMSQTHDYRIREWGHDYIIYTVYDNGLLLDMAGWGCGIRAGDYIIMTNKAGETRYQITNITYHRDPVDLWYATAKFAPRQG